MVDSIVPKLTSLLLSAAEHVKFGGRVVASILGETSVLPEQSGRDGEQNEERFSRSTLSSFERVEIMVFNLCVFLLGTRRVATHPEIG